MIMIQVPADVHPQSFALEKPTSVATRPIASPTAPTRSNDGGSTRRVWGRSTIDRAPMTRARTAESQNSTCQSNDWMTSAESGSPRAPPTPRVADTAASAVLVILGGVTSRTMLIATGMYPMAIPWSTRPTRTTTKSSETAHSNDPASSTPAEITRIGFLPKMSASRPETGIATAPPRRVAVTTQEVLEALVLSRRGSSDWIGMTRDCMSAAQRLEKPSTTTMSSGWFVAVERSCRTGGELAVAGSCVVKMSLFPRWMCKLHTGSMCRLHSRGFGNNEVPTNVTRLASRTEETAYDCSRRREPRARRPRSRRTRRYHRRHRRRDPVE
jgi:hypothetical protein